MPFTSQINCNLSLIKSHFLKVLVHSFSNVSIGNKISAHSSRGAHNQYFFHVFLPRFSSFYICGGLSTSVNDLTVQKRQDASVAVLARDTVSRFVGHIVPVAYMLKYRYIGIFTDL